MDHGVLALGAARIAEYGGQGVPLLVLARLHDDCARFIQATGIDVLRAGHLGAHPDLVPLILARHDEALGGDIRMNCDACA